MKVNRYDNFPLEECGWQGCLKGVSMAVGAIIGLAICALSSCTSTKYVNVPETHTDTLYISKMQRDSIFLHDSIHVTERQKGDTVWLEVERWHTKYVDKVTHDTTYIATHDTIPQPYPVPEYIKKELTWWQKTRMRLGELMITVLLVLIFVGIYKLRKLFPF